MFGGDPDSDPTTVTLTAPPSSGTVNWNPYGGGPNPAYWFFSYTPNSGVNHVTDSFTFTTTDPFGESGETKVFVRITDTGPAWWLAPVANADQDYWGDRWETHLTGSVLSNDINPMASARPWPGPGLLLVSRGIPMGATTSTLWTSPPS